MDADKFQNGDHLTAYDIQLFVLAILLMLCSSWLLRRYVQLNPGSIRLVLITIITVVGAAFLFCVVEAFTYV